MSTDCKEPHPDAIFTVPLGQLDRDDADWAGGKGANLGEPIKAGYPVPNGFVVTTDAYDFMLENTNLGRTIVATLMEGPTDGAAIREAFPVADVLPEIVEVHRDLLVAVAVRSRATAEDLPDAVRPWR